MTKLKCQINSEIQKSKGKNQNDNSQPTNKILTFALSFCTFIFARDLFRPVLSEAVKELVLGIQDFKTGCLKQGGKAWHEVIWERFCLWTFPKNS